MQESYPEEIYQYCNLFVKIIDVESLICSNVILQL